MEVAAPKYEIADRVFYTDNHGRQQTGEVYRIKASWASYMRGPPLIVYTVSHPSYRNKRMHAAEGDILGPALNRSGPTP